MNEDPVLEPLRILYVEDSDDDFSFVQQALEASLPAVRLRRSIRAEEALALVAAEPLSVDLLLADQRLPVMSGLELCRRVLDRKLPLPLVILTGVGTEELVVEALKSGVDDYVIKDVHRTYLKVLPVVLPEVVARHRERLARRKAEEELRRARDRLEQQVREATAELVAANEHLRREVDERRRAEDSLREAEQKYRTLVEQANDAIIILQDERVVYHNPICEDLLGYTVEKARGRSFLDFIAPEDRELVGERYYERLKGEAAPHQYEVTVITQSGEPLVMDVKPRVIEYQGRPATMVIMRDITARKRTEEALRNSERRLAEIINFLPDATFVIDREGRVLAWNQAMEEMSGVKAEEIRGKSDYEYALPFYGVRRPMLIDLVLQPDEKIEQVYDALERDRDTLVAESYVHSFRSGAYLWGKARPMYDSRGQVVGAIASIRDITARKEAEDRLRASEAEKKAILDASMDRIRLVDEDLRIIWANQKTAKDINATPEQLIGRCCYEVFVDEKSPCAGCPTPKAFASGHLEHAVLHQLKSKDGTGKLYWGESYWEGYALPLKDESGNVVRVIQIFRDITARKRAEEELRRSKEFLDNIINALDDPVFVKDDQHRWVILNARACELMGWPREELIGKSDYDLFPKEQADVFWEKDALVLASGETNINEEEITCHGRLHTISTKKSLFTDSVTGRKFIAGTIRDITESKQAEQRLHRYQTQLRSLASELALTEERERRRLATDLHDSIGQSLAMAKLRLDLLRSGTTGEQPAEELAEVARLIEQAIQHTRFLTFELSPPVLYELGLEAALESLVERMQHEHDIRIELASDGGSSTLGENLAVFCFRAVQELLINVVKHARTREARLSLSREGTTLKITVSDHGVGFVPGTMPNQSDHSSGFGLFSIDERVRHFGGHLEVDSRRGRGTRVTLVIPLSPGP